MFLSILGLGERIQSLEDLSGKLTDFDECTRDLNSTLKKLEDKLDSHNRLGSSAKDPKHQDKIRVSRRKIHLPLTAVGSIHARDFGLFLERKLSS